MATEKTKKTKLYNCEKCEFNTHKKTDYSRHINSRKHLNSIVINVNNDEIRQKSYDCDICDKTFMDRSGLWRHRRKCREPPDSTVTSIPLPPQFDAALVIELLKQNQEFSKVIIEQNKQLILLAKPIGNQPDN